MRRLVVVALAVAMAGTGTALASFEPASAASAASAVANGLKGEYFTIADNSPTYALGELKATVTEPAIDFPSLTGTLSDLTGKGEWAGARWTGKITPQHSEAYTFSAIGDNGFRLWVNGSLVIDHWVNDWDIEQTAAPVQLVAGTAYDVKLEYFQATGGANMFLRWASVSQPKQVVPASAFTPPDGYVILPVTATVGSDGKTLDVGFAGTVAGVSADLLKNLRLSVDARTWPLTSATLLPDGVTIRVGLGVPIVRGSRARLGYDGAGALTIGGVPAPTFSALVTNSSTYRLTTPWTAKLDKDHPLREYPRPQQVRKAWQNLNGRWQFAAATAGQAPPVGKNLAEQIVVPYAVESTLSGLERHEDHMFYRRTISVPAGWQVGRENRLRLNFGAVDYHAVVWVNGTKVAEHQGGYTAFSADITDALTGAGQQEIIVGVEDSTGREQPTGKQSSNPSGIFYTATSGIWQTVWMEPVPKAAIDTVVSTPNLRTSSAAVTVKSAGASATALATVTAIDTKGNEVGRVTGPVNAALTLPIPKAHLWSPTDPYLYGLVVRLRDKEKNSGDVVNSYLGMRSIEILKVNGVNKIALNGKPTFLMSTLDQGFWPDGNYTPASNAAYTFDLQAHKDLGFNTVRKHIKVEPARWYYEADRLGLMVWQDFVSGAMGTEQGRAAWKTQARAEVEQLRSSPSIVGWIPFNEGWGEWDKTVTGQIADEVKVWDPSRIVNAHSGVNCCNSLGDSGRGDVIDWHNYFGPALHQPDATRAAIDGEHGGFGLSILGHTWPGASANPYGDLGTKDALTQAYVANTEKLVSPARCYLSGSVYTQISDVENEINGFFTYDRRVLKMTGPAVKAANEKVIAAGSSTGSQFPPGTPGLGGVGSWTLNENTGTTAGDSSGKGLNATLRNGATWTPGRSASAGSAVQLNGLNQSVETSSPAVDTTGSYSVSAWAKLDSVPGGWTTVVSQDGKTGASPFFLQYGQGQFAFSFPDGPRASLAMTPEVGRWYHLAGVRDAAGQTLKLYLDGRQVASVGVCGGNESTGSLAIGRGQWDGRAVDFWPGAVDQVQVFDRALTDAEVATLAAG